MNKHMTINEVLGPDSYPNSTVLPRVLSAIELTNYFSAKEYAEVKKSLLSPEVRSKEKTAFRAYCWELLSTCGYSDITAWEKVSDVSTLRISQIIELGQLTTSSVATRVIDALIARGVEKDEAKKIRGIAHRYDHDYDTFVDHVMNALLDAGYQP